MAIQIMNDLDEPASKESIVNFLADLARNESVDEETRTKAKELLDQFAGKGDASARAAVEKVEKKDALRASMGLPSLFATRVSKAVGTSQVFATLTADEARRVVARKGR